MSSRLVLEGISKNGSNSKFGASSTGVFIIILHPPKRLHLFFMQWDMRNDELVGKNKNKQ